jgi:hypothetical protein
MLWLRIGMQNLEASGITFAAIVVVMAEGKGTLTPKQVKEARKRKLQRESRKESLPRRPAKGKRYDKGGLGMRSQRPSCLWQPKAVGNV